MRNACNKRLMNKAFTALMLAAGIALPLTCASQSLVVTPGSSAAYVFCAKSKSAACRTSTVGRWIFKLQHESAFPNGDARRQDSFRDDGTSGQRLLWNSGTAPRVIDRVYVGYGEFTYDPTDPSKGTFSGIVDMPPIARPASCTAYPSYDYCTMNGAGSGLTLDTPYRSCTTTYSWVAGAFGGPVAATGTNWNPNTGVIECRSPLGSFATNMGSGIGNCVAHYVQRRGSSATLFTNTYYQNEYIYQARVFNLQIRQASDFTDLNCTPISN